MLTKKTDVKTSLRIRTDLWRSAKALALAGGIELQDVINAALQAYLPKDIVISIEKTPAAKGRRS